MKKVLPILSIIFAVVLVIFSVSCTVARINFNRNGEYDIAINTSLCSVVFLAIAIIHAGLIFICNSKSVKVILLITIYPFIWLSPTMWSFVVSLVIYIIAYSISKCKLKKLGHGIISCIIVIHVLLYFGLLYLTGPKTLSTEEYVSPNGTYVVIVETFHHNDIGASDTFVRYRMNESIDGVFFNLLPKEKTLAEFIHGIDEDTEPEWTSDDAFVFEGVKYPLSKYDWK